MRWPFTKLIEYFKRPSFCSQGTILLERVEASNGLEKLLDEGLELIKREIYPQATQSIRSRDKKANRIVELNKPDFRSNFGDKRGVYKTRFERKAKSGRIFLQKGQWCLKTLLHEALHTVSVFSARKDLGRKFWLLNEGLTEFFTGYLLHRSHGSCHEAWKTKKYSACSISYFDQVRLWCTLCNFISLQEVQKIYFRDPAAPEWEKIWKQFIQRINKAGYRGFTDAVKGDKKPKEILKHFPEDFRRIYHSRDQNLDYGRILR